MSELTASERGITESTRTAQTGEVQEPKPAWWGVTVGSLTYATYAPDKDTARGLVFRAIGVPEEDNIVPAFVERHGEEFQPQLTKLFGEAQRAVRVIPFSMNPWPQQV